MGATAGVVVLIILYYAFSSAPTSIFLRVYIKATLEFSLRRTAIFAVDWSTILFASGSDRDRRNMLIAGPARIF